MALHAHFLGFICLLRFLNKILKVLHVAYLLHISPVRTIFLKFPNMSITTQALEYILYVECNWLKNKIFIFWITFFVQKTFKRNISILFYLIDIIIINIISESALSFHQLHHIHYTTYRLFTKNNFKNPIIKVYDRYNLQTWCKCLMKIKCTFYFMKYVHLYVSFKCDYMWTAYHNETEDYVYQHLQTYILINRLMFNHYIWQNKRPKLYMVIDRTDIAM